VTDVGLAGPIARVSLQTGDGLKATALALAPTVQHLASGDRVTFGIAPDVVQIYLTDETDAAPAAGGATKDEAGEADS